MKYQSFQLKTFSQHDPLQFFLLLLLPTCKEHQGTELWAMIKRNGFTPDPRVVKLNSLNISKSANFSPNGRFKHCQKNLTMIL